MDITAPGVSRTAGRRRFLSAVGLGGALSALPVAARVASATKVARASATTSASGDAELLAFAQGLELSAVELYHLAATALGGEPVVTAQLVDVFGAHHQAAADALSAALGRTAPNTSIAALVEDLSESFGDATQVVEAARALEEQAAATHLELIGKVSSASTAKLLAGVALTEARSAAALAAVGGENPLPGTAVFSTKAALSPSDYPVGA